MKKLLLIFTAFLILISNASYAQWTTSGNDIYNSNTGNVAIGTSTPIGMLTVSGTSIFSSGIDSRLSIVPTINQTSTAGYRALWISPYTASNGSGTRLLIDAGNNSAANGSGTHTSMLTLDNNGNVNIAARLAVGFVGTLSSSQLSIGGGFSVSSAFSVHGFGLQVMAETYTSNTSSGTIPLQGTSTYGTPTLAAVSATTITNASTVYLNGAPTAGANVTITNPYTFYVNSGATYFGGNVLIGTPPSINTSYQLNVAGAVRANAITVNTTGADFVFEPTYKLPSLSSVDLYIKRNHHLPEVASASDMQANGLNLGENQTKLLQKVEELTLYLIDKDKKISDQQQEIDLLKQQMSIQEKHYKELDDAVLKLTKAKN